MTRDEHLQWCKDRAMGVCHSGDTANALASMFSDIRKHPETEDHPAVGLGAMLMFSGQLSTREDVEKFIKGFN